MKKFILPVLFVLSASFFVYEFFIAAKPLPTSMAFVANTQWDSQPRAILSDFTGAHDPKISFSADGDLQLLAVGEEPGSSQLQLFISDDNGETFAAGVPISAKGVKLDSHGENSPVLVNGKSGPVVLWTQGAAKGSNIMSAHSKDGGASFSKPVRVNDGKTGSSAYLGALATDGKVLFAAWLDGRDNATDGTTSIYCSRSTDGGVTWQKNVRITQSVCPCCRPNLVIFPNGKIMMAWRNVYPGQIRDMACVVSDDGGKTWSEPRRVAVDKWHIRGCPETGPRLVRVDNRVYAAWFSYGTGKHPGIRLTWSDDYGSTWKKPTIVSRNLENAAQPFLVANSDGQVYVTFRASAPKENDQEDQLKTFVVKISHNDQISMPMPVPVPGQDLVSFPTMSTNGEGNFWLAWNGKDKIWLSRGQQKKAS